MKRRTLLPVLLALIVIAHSACQSGGARAPETFPAEPVGYLVDARIGFDDPTSVRGAEKRFETAWGDLRSGRLDSAEERLSQLQARSPDYLPATLAQAAIAIERNDLDEAQSLVDRVLEKDPDYLAAKIYGAEITARRGEIERAYEAWREISGQPGAPAFALARVDALRTQLFDQTFEKARQETDLERSASLLRQALGFRPDAGNARILLVQKLIEGKKFDDARRQLEPLITANAGVAAPDIDEALAEIDAGKGRYQEAISRFDRLARENPQRFSARLAQVKQRWLEANLPPQYLRALASPALTRQEVSVLLYWKVTAVRFAQPAQPPIAVDIGNVAGREEFVRALALRLFQVDTLTRRAGPDHPVSAGTLLRVLWRVLALRGVPQCGRGASGETDIARVASALQMCGISAESLASAPEATVSGRQVAEILVKLDTIR